MHLQNSSDELETYLPKIYSNNSNLTKFTYDEVDYVLEQQEHNYKSQTYESFVAMSDLCTQEKPNVQAICRLAWDIVEMSKAVPCCTDNTSTVDMRFRTCCSFKILAGLIDTKDISNTDFSIITNFIATYVGNHLKQCGQI